MGAAGSWDSRLLGCRRGGSQESRSLGPEGGGCGGVCSTLSHRFCARLFAGDVEGDGVIPHEDVRNAITMVIGLERDRGRGTK